MACISWGSIDYDKVEEGTHIKKWRHKDPRFAKATRGFLHYDGLGAACPTRRRMG